MPPARRRSSAPASSIWPSPATTRRSRRRTCSRAARGSARVCWSFGELDPSADAAELTWSGDRLSGTLRFVDGAAAATHLVIARSGGRPGLAIVTLSPRATTPAGSSPPAPSVPTAGPKSCWPTAGDVRAARQRPAGRPAAHRPPRPPRPCPRRGPSRLRDGGRLRQGAQAVRPADRPLPGDPAQAREQPDRARRRAGDTGARGQGFDLGPPAWRYFAAAAVAFGGPALRRVSLETHHAFGAIGYAEEHEAPRHFRRAHLDTLAFGGAAAARSELAAQLLDDPKALPEYDLGVAGNAFRAEVRAWLEQHWSGERKAAFDARRSTIASSTPRSPATSAGPAGSASAGRASSAGRRAGRSSRSPSSR